jgi:hypothetical protein
METERGAESQRRVHSSDGTAIAYEWSGKGPAGRVASRRSVSDAQEPCDEALCAASR